MAPKKTTVFVVGLGMVGIAFIEKLLNLDSAKEFFIVTCGEEPTLAYNRVGLTGQYSAFEFRSQVQRRNSDFFVEYFQHRNIEDLYLNDASWYAEQEPDRFAFHIGEQVRFFPSCLISFSDGAIGYYGRYGQ